jgi:peptidoglycan/LPS O-acetylase OafA/YrhL
MNRTTSLYLDSIRVFAACVVFLSHVSFQNISGGQLRFMASTGVEAVDIFFVLSGFVIAYSCSTREQTARNYIISRASRIYSVAIPALILTAILDAIGMIISPQTYTGAYQPISLGLILRSVLFIGEQWNSHRFPGSDGPYWSLGFEVWYYIAFGVFLFSFQRWRWAATVAVLLFIGPKVALMFPAWLMGVAVYRLTSANTLPQSTGWMLLISPLLVLVSYQLIPHSPLQQFTAVTLDFERLKSTGQDYLISALFSAHLIGFSTVSPTFAPLLEWQAQRIRWIAGASFSIYLVHLPIMHIVSAMSPWPKSSPLTLLLLLTITPLACFVFAEVSERRKDKVKVLMMKAPNGFKWLKSLHHQCDFADEGACSKCGRFSGDR